MSTMISTALTAALAAAAISAASATAFAQSPSSLSVESDAAMVNQAAVNRCISLYGEGFMPVGDSESCVKFSGDVRITYSAGSTTTKNTVKLPPGVTLPARP